jgi:predicted HTH transcriptional regulator
VINAVVHADYAQRGAPIRLSLFDDRLEVENPGLLPFGLTVADILQGISKLRNRVIGRVFKELGLIEQWGSGIGRMIAACREAGLPEPGFEEIGWHFRVTLSKQRAAPQLTDPVERAILALLADGEGHTTAEVARTIRRTPRATRTRLAGLVGRGVVAEVGSGPRDPRRRYYLAEDARARPEP